jgi:hypothetical protein
MFFLSFTGICLVSLTALYYLYPLIGSIAVIPALLLFIFAWWVVAKLLP